MHRLLDANPRELTALFEVTEDTPGQKKLKVRRAKREGTRPHPGQDSLWDRAPGPPVLDRDSDADRRVAGGSHTDSLSLSVLSCDTGTLMLSLLKGHEIQARGTSSAMYLMTRHMGKRHE